MDPEKRKRLEAAGWQFGDAADFLGLTPEEREEVRRKLAERPRPQPDDEAGRRKKD